MSGFHISLNENEWVNWQAAARAVLSRVCRETNVSPEQVEETAQDLREANHRHLANDHWVTDDSAPNPVDSDARWFADLYDDVEIYVPDPQDICPAEAPEPQPVVVQPEQSPVPPTPPPVDADAGTQPDAGADDGDAGTTPPADAGTDVADAGEDADGDTVNDADQAEADDAARRRDAPRRENGNGHDAGTPPQDAGRPETPVIPGT